MQILPIKIKILKNRLGSYLIGPKWRFWRKFFLDISQKKFGSSYAQSPRKCSNIEILAKIEGKEAKFFSKIYEGHIRIWFRSKKNSKLSHACVPLRSSGIDSQRGGPVRLPYLSYLPAMLHRQVKSNPRNRFLVSFNVYKYVLRTRELLLSRSKLFNGLKGQGPSKKC
jgi:hypothetical protein